MSRERQHLIPRFRWRIIPAFFLIGMSCFVGVLYYNNVIIGDLPITHPNHFLIFVAGVLWLLASGLCWRGRWGFAIAVTSVGFALPFFRSIH